MENQVNEEGQTQFSNSIEKTNQKKDEKSRWEGSYSFLGVITTFILIVIIIALGDRLIFDLNKALNPVVDQEYTNFKVNQYTDKGSEMSEFSQEIERAVDISDNSKVYYPKSEENRYLMYKLIIQAAIVIPLLVVASLLFYFKKKDNRWRPLVIGFILAVSWLMLHFLGEALSFTMDVYKNITTYVVLILLVFLFGWLTFYFQSKKNK